jgi:hypothetical protein
VPPSGFAASGRPVELPAPNGIHFHPPAGLLVPGADAPAGRRDLTDRLLGHHLHRVRALLTAAAGVPAADLRRAVRPGLVVVDFEGEEASAAVMAERLVFTLEVWVAAMAGQPYPEPGAVAAGGEAAALLRRFDVAAPAFARIVRRIRARQAWDDAFVDALCEPPQSFTYGGVVAHVLSYGAVRREALAGVLAELGVRDPGEADPISWEAGERRP